MGGRLFSAILQYLQEQYEKCPMLDKLNRLEKLGYIQSTEAWQNIRTTSTSLLIIILMTGAGMLH